MEKMTPGETDLENLKRNLAKDLVILEESDIGELTKELIESVYENVYKILLSVRKDQETMKFLREDKWDKWFNKLPKNSQEYLKSIPIWYDRDVAAFVSISIVIGFIIGFFTGYR